MTNQLPSNFSTAFSLIFLSWIYPVNWSLWRCLCQHLFINGRDERRPLLGRPGCPPDEVKAPNCPDLWDNRRFVPHLAVFCCLIKPAWLTTVIQKPSGRGRLIWIWRFNLVMQQVFSCYISCFCIFPPTSRWNQLCSTESFCFLYITFSLFCQVKYNVWLLNLYLFLTYQCLLLKSRQ